MYIRTLAQFNSELDKLYSGIETDCRDCQDPDCMGFIWLMKKEVKNLYQIGVPLVQINDGPTFIHSFPTDKAGNVDVSVRYPICSQLCQEDKRCKIHHDRPMVCHLYPLGLETKEDGTIVWAIHKDCLHIRRKSENSTLAKFKNKALDIINRLSPKLLKEILDTYSSVDSISQFPNGENNYIILKEVTNHVEMQSCT